MQRTPPSNLSEHQYSGSEPNLHIISDEKEVNITQRNKRRRGELSLDSILDEMRSMFDEWSAKQDRKYELFQTMVTEIKTQNLEIRNCIDFWSTKNDEMKEKLDKLERDRLDNLAYIQSLEQKVDALERNSKAAGLEIRNVPPQSTETKETLMKYVIHGGKSLNLTILPSDIKDVYRINTRTKTNKPIVAEFSSILTKEKFIRSLKNYNKNNSEKFNTRNLQLEGSVTPVYISENLTYTTKRLYYYTREFCKSNGFRFCWTTYGKVYIRKKEGSPAIRVSVERDLENLKCEK